MTTIHPLVLIVSRLHGQIKDAFPEKSSVHREQEKKKEEKSSII